VREGDIFVLQPDTVWSRTVSLFCGGWGHIVTIVLHQGRLMALSVYPPPCGLVIEPRERPDNHARVDRMNRQRLLVEV
jgi:hypothetical protein